MSPVKACSASAADEYTYPDVRYIASAVSSKPDRRIPPRTPMVAWLTPSGSALGVRTDGSVIAASSLFPRQPRRAPAGFAAMAVGVQLTLETVKHVVGRGDADRGGDLGCGN